MVTKFDSRQAAARHRPIAHGPEAPQRDAPEAKDAQAEARRSSEPRMNAPVVRDSQCDELDPYADVPCTD
jgi:hypothetical protein